MRWFSSRLKLYPAWRRLLQPLLFWVAVCLSLTAHAAPETIWIGHVEGEPAAQAAHVLRSDCSMYPDAHWHVPLYTW